MNICANLNERLLFTSTTSRPPDIRSNVCAIVSGTFTTDGQVNAVVRITEGGDAVQGGTRGIRCGSVLRFLRFLDDEHVIELTVRNCQVAL